MGFAHFAIMKLNIILPTLAAAASAEKVNFDGHKVFRINDHSLDIQKLYKFDPQVDVWSQKRGAVDVRINAGDVLGFKHWLKQEGLNADVYIEDVQELINGETHRNRLESTSIGDINDFNYTTYHTYEEIHQWTHEICRLHQDICHVVNFGKTYEGRGMFGLHISAHPQGGNHHEHAYFMMAGIHAREWIAPASTMAVVNRLLRNYKEGHKQERDILHNMDWYVLPLTNVDGYVYTWEEDRMWRKTRTPNEGSICVGKDPNRNWATEKWDDDIGSSGNPCSSTYRGEQPMSEPCVHNVDQFVKRTHEPSHQSHVRCSLVLTNVALPQRIHRRTYTQRWLPSNNRKICHRCYLRCSWNGVCLWKLL